MVNEQWQIGILGSIVGGLLILFLQWLWINLVPQFVQRFYHHEPMIDGKWDTTFNEGPKEYHEVVTVTQKGRKVSGQIILKENNAEDSVYNFEGTFKHLILTCTYQSTDPSEYEQGVFALRYKQNKFEGQHVLLSKESDNYIASNYSWTRK